MCVCVCRRGLWIPFLWLSCFGYITNIFLDISRKKFSEVGNIHACAFAFSGLLVGFVFLPLFLVQTLHSSQPNTGERPRWLRKWEVPLGSTNAATVVKIVITQASSKMKLEMGVLTLLHSDLCKRGVCFWLYFSQRARIWVGVKGCAYLKSTFFPLAHLQEHAILNSLSIVPHSACFQITTLICTSLDSKGSCVWR